ncbi:hypothetical protein QGN29_08220 [Temperatibacter marinus]|uniref:DNA-directed DNA polymerase n=1 Tax=Temperatibacter marinus TaxID=1456591 RepID=A0AA52ED79_9PROT|nr:hypothetical protein [Temperatibacter marinus]WND01543.1 hypothetical protein QGN29_08220 [Temperatibacter marinus]
MQKETDITYAYIDFDGFFGSVEEQHNPALHGRPVAVLPFAETTSTCVIAANYKAKAFGIKTGTSIPDAYKLCPDITLIPQDPRRYLDYHLRIKKAITKSIPIFSVGSIDEVTCKLDRSDKKNPEALAAKIKEDLRQEIGCFVTCTIGMGPSRLLAKTASDMNKPNGLTILRPQDLPGPLLNLELDDIPYIAKGYVRRLNKAGIWTVRGLWNTSPKQLRAIWGNVEGERMWYQLHGYDVVGEPTKRRMFGHGRVLPPDWRHMDKAVHAARLLLVKAARRMRREGYVARKVGLSLKTSPTRWSDEEILPYVDDDHTILAALTTMWQKAEQSLPASVKVPNLYVYLHELHPKGSLQHDIFTPSDPQHDKWSKLTHAIDHLNEKYQKTSVSLGPWLEPPGGYAGGKIAFTRIPDEKDFW